MFDLQKRLENLRSEFNTTWQKLNINQRLKELSALEQEVAVPEIWNNPDEAREKTTKVASLHAELDDWVLLKTQLSDIAELLELGDDSLLDELNEQIAAMELKLNELKIALRFTGKYDHNDGLVGHARAHVSALGGTS